MSVGTPRPMFPAYLPSTMKSWPRWATKAFCLTLTTRLSTTATIPRPRWTRCSAISTFNRNIRTLFIAEAGKPDPAAYRRACAMLGLPPEQVVCVGDQLFRDIRGANRTGLDSILVDFIRLPGETHYGKKRVLEKAILWFYHRDPRRRGRLDGIGK